MKSTLNLKSYIKFIGILLLVPMSTQAQCELFKSEINGVETHTRQISEIVDSLQTYAEVAAFGADTKMARANAKKVELLIGKALASADEAVTMASESQYYSEICGITDVESYAIDTESHTIDARDFTDQAYTNAKKAVTAKNLGDIQYYMRKYQVASREAQKSADDAALAAAIAHSSCDHSDAHVSR